VTAVTIGEGYQVWPLVGRGQAFGTNFTANQSLIISQADGAFGTSLRTPELDASTVAFAVPGFSVTSEFRTSDSRAHITYQTTTGTVSLTATVSITTVGAVNSTLSNTRSTTQFGGYGWNSTVSTTITAQSGRHRATIVDSSSWTTTDINWSSTTTSFSIAPGQAIGLQALPIARSTTSTIAANPFLNYSRTPVT
jgi:hypothetical protein